MHASVSSTSKTHLRTHRKRLGDLLVDAGTLTKEQLQEALDQQRQRGGRLGQTVVDLGFADSKTVGKALQERLGIPYIDVSEYKVSPDTINLIHERMIRRHLVLPLRIDEGVLEVAMVDPLNLKVVDDLKLLTSLRIAPQLAMEREMLHAINRYFDVRLHAEQAVRDIESEREGTEAEDVLSVSQLIDLAESSPTIRLVNSMIHGALSQSASDIHLEPQENDLRVRYRVDGMLRNELNVGRFHHAAIVSRIKVMARLNIAERRRPQDGRIAVQHNGKEYDFRVSIMPTVFGEKTVIRILDKSSIHNSFDRIGFFAEEQHRFEWFITRPHGMILVTGPTGSGKSTTLYAALNQINTPEKNIITIEDPVEYHLPGITQTAVNDKVGITFATGLRTIVRQDPDVIMVGEIRDRETAETAVQAALTGHLVFSTLHTNDAAGSLVRLMNMGVEPFLIASSVIGTVGQRLVRVICPVCRELYEPSQETRRVLGMNFNGRNPEPLHFARGRGCTECHHSGYRGRTAVLEVLKMTDSMREMVLRRDSAVSMRDLAVQEGMNTMRDTGIQKVMRHITTPEEILRMVYVEGEG